MSKPLIVSLPHSLGKEEALHRLKPALSQAAAAFPVLAVDEESWTGDRMDFRVRALGQVASGLVDVADDHIRLEVTLPWFLKRFADGVEKALRSRGRLLLGGPSSGIGPV